MEKLNISPTIGFNYYDVQFRRLTGATQGGFASPGIFNLGNSSEQAKITQDHYHSRILGLFGNLSVGWDDKIFLEYSYRNDWSSTLPDGVGQGLTKDQDFDYHAVGLSAIVSDYLGLSDNPIFNYMKFRAGWGQTGKDATAYALTSLYTVNPLHIDFGQNFVVQAPFAGQSTATRQGQIGNNTLEPELTTTVEVGADFGFLDNKVQLSYTYYNSVHEKQIVTILLPNSSGFTQTTANIGEIENKGHEVGLTLTPINRQENGLRWDLNLTWSRNRNVVNQISQDLDELTYYNSGRGVTQVAKVGHPVGTWKGQVARKTPDGRPIVDDAGAPVYTTTDEVIGNTQPDWLAGLNSTLAFKGFRLGFLFDAREGGTIFSLTKFATEFNGTSLSSITNDRVPFVIPNSVVENDDGTFTPNTTPIPVDVFVDDGNYSRNVIDGSFVKLREVTLGYSIPSSITNTLKMRSASIQLFVKNPRFWLPDVNSYGDPEVNNPVGTATNVSGVESTQTPPSKSYGFNINITF
jgi:hypothetical protein